MREFTVMFHSVQEIAQFATVANRQSFPVHFDYKGSRLDAKSLLSLCALPLRSPVRVQVPDRAACEKFLEDITPFRCEAAETESYYCTLPVHMLVQMKRKGVFL